MDLIEPDVTVEDAAEAAERGAKLLDEFDSDWFNQISLHSFDISSCSRCVLGQLFGSYTSGTIMLSLRDSYYYGFDIPADLEDEDPDEYFEYLQAEWIAHIQKRRNNG